jgi:hypothetical protein
MPAAVAAVDLAQTARLAVMSVAADTTRHSIRAGLLARPIRAFLQLSESEALFETRGFPQSAPSAQLALETIGRIFIGGYNATLAAPNIDAVRRYVDSIPVVYRGFAAEGAAMGAAVADALPFSPPILPGCIAAFNSDFTYLTHVGAGWALARVPWRRGRILAPLDPIHRWLAIDGSGFHDTYFYHRRVITGWRRERSGYTAQAYDQGVGRALWFISGGSVPNATHLISALASVRQADLWSGLGIAMAYAGPVTRGDVVSALKSADTHAACFAQGIAFGCEARTLADYIPGHTDVAAHAIWNNDAREVARLVRETRSCLPNAETNPPRYKTWRENVALAFSRTRGGK